MEIIVKDFKPHFNVALDKVVTSQRQYNDEMKKGGYIPYEQAKENCAKIQEERKKYTTSEEARSWMREVKSKSDSAGNVKLSDREIDYLKKHSMMNRENAALKEAMEKRRGY
jgi:hypothetical protein